jgi:hypothetical protein
MIKTKFQRKNWLEGRSGSSEKCKGRELLDFTFEFINAIKKSEFPSEGLLATPGRLQMCRTGETWHTRTCVLSAMKVSQGYPQPCRTAVTSEPCAKNWLFELYDTLSHESFTRMTVTLWSDWCSHFLGFVSGLLAMCIQWGRCFR